MILRRIFFFVSSWTNSSVLFTGLSCLHKRAVLSEILKVVFFCSGIAVYNECREPQRSTHTLNYVCIYTLVNLFIFGFQVTLQCELFKQSQQIYQNITDLSCIASTTYGILSQAKKMPLQQIKGFLLITSTKNHLFCMRIIFLLRMF